MATVTIPQATSFSVLDTAATASTGVLRDASGNILGAQVQGSELKTSGTLVLTRVSKTATFTADANGTYYACDATGGAITANLPPAASVTGRVYHFKKLDNVANVTLDANASETLDGATTLVLSTQYAKTTIMSNGTNWEVIS